MISKKLDGDGLVDSVEVPLDINDPRYTYCGDLGEPPCEREFIIEIPDTNQTAYNISQLLDIGNNLFESQSYAGASEYFDKVLSIDPNNVEALDRKGLSLVKLGDYENAIKFYDRALKIDPQYTST